MTENDRYVQEGVFQASEPEEFNEKRKKREHYRERLAEKLKDPEFRNIAGFPLGSDEAILDLSDPPFYTACPNPFMREIMTEWQKERNAVRKDLKLPIEKGLEGDARIYHREPFAADVSEGKNHPIYNAHSYHTKVPHKAIMRYILHYTDPGDIVLDGFCGTGMTGVAAQLCGDKHSVEALGYRVNRKGEIFDGNKRISKLGVRKAVLNDLSPAATFIAYNYNTPVDKQEFEREAKRILSEVEKECGWMYATTHSDGRKGRINYTVWSDVLRCPQCGTEMVFWDVAVDRETGKVRKNWSCPGCNSSLSKSPSKVSGALKAERVMDTIYDRAISETIQQARQVPVWINYSVGKERFEKEPNPDDLALIKKIEGMNIPYSFPISRLPKGFNTKQPEVSHGLTHVHHFYTRRNLWVLAGLFKLSDNEALLKYLLTASMINLSLLYRFRINGKGGNVSGTLYIPSTTQENNPFCAIHRKIKILKRAFLNRFSDSIIETRSSSFPNNLHKNIFDYIFIDPPFGGNLMYSELNFLWEAWLGVITNNVKEAIVNKEQQKGLLEYQDLIEDCFKDFHRLLKPGRWMTVEFHNSKNAVWVAIQEALQRAGFIVADVRKLDKEQATFKQVTTTSAVKQDLVISAYKPSTGFERRFTLESGTVNGAWEFIRHHLEQLPMPTLNGGKIEVQGERTPYVLYDRMLAFHLVRGLTIPLSASEFYQGLSQRWLNRDGMVFTAAQTTRYDQMRLAAKSVQQLPLFVTDEQSAIQWLRMELDEEKGSGPQTYGDIQPKFMQQMHEERYEKIPELLVLLKQNFLGEDDGRWFVPDPENMAHLEALREQDLLREFAVYTRGRGRIRIFRGEAIKAGFKKAWEEHRYRDICRVAERLPAAVLQEDAKLKLFYQNALNRAPAEIEQAQLI